MIIAYYRATYVDFWGTIVTVILMSISTLFYIIAGQWLFGKMLRLFPISGYDTGVNMLKFVFLPAVIGVISGIGTGVRFYRTIFLEEVNRDYVRTARAKGLGEAVVAVQARLEERDDPHLDKRRVSNPISLHRQPRHGELFLNSRTRQFYD